MDFRLIDSHVHLQDYPDTVDRHAMVREGVAAGVSYFLCNGTSEDDWPEVQGLAVAHKEVIPCFGVHPWWTDRVTEGWEERLAALIAGTRSGVGETGLDKLSEVDMRVQTDAFVTQLAMARECRRPVMVHCVRAWGAMMDVLRREKRLPCGMLMHSYGGSPDLVKPLADMGAYFSFSGKTLYTNYARARRAILAVPRDRLLIETDAPCMLPPAEFCDYVIEGELNHPANLRPVLHGLADLLGDTAEGLANDLWKNGQAFFGPLIGGDSLV